MARDAWRADVARVALTAMLLAVACSRHHGKTSPATAPTAPNAVAAQAGNQHVMVSWSAPTSDGGSAIAAYHLSTFLGAQLVSDIDLPATTFAHDAASLVNGQLYSFRVRATNARGDGPDASVDALPFGPASAPGAVTIQKNPIRLRWPIPSESGGLPILGFRITPFVGTTAMTPIQVSWNASASAIVAADAGTTIPFLPEDNTYTFEVAAVTSGGIGAATVSTAMTLGCGIPGLPQLEVGTSPKGVAVGDYDGDGVSDVVVINAGQLLSYVGAGNGTYKLVEKTPDSAVGLRALRVGDLDGDTRPDVVFGTQNGGIGIASGGSDGTFAFSGPSSSVSNQPITDIVLGRFTGGGLEYVAGTALGTYGAGLSSTLPAQTLASGDLDDDGSDDLLITNNEYKVEVFWGSTNGLGVNTTIPAGSQVWSSAVGDFDEDGNPDIATANFFSISDGSVSIIPGLGGRTFGASQEFPAVAGSAHVAIADLDLDGHLDVVAQTGTRFSVLLGRGDGQLDAHVDYGFDSNGPDYTSLLVVADVNSDGYPDVVIADQANRILFFRGNGDGTFPVIPSYPSGSNSLSVIAGDFDGDARVDIASIAAGSDAFQPFLGNGDGTFTPGTALATVPAGGGSSFFGVVGDFNGDGALDAVTAAFTSQGASASFIPGNGDGTFGTPVLSSAGFTETPETTIVGDFNEDGNLDVVMGTIDGTRPVGLLLGNGDGTFSTSTLVSDARGLAVADFNGDLHLDIATSKTGQAEIFFGDGAGAFTETAIDSTCTPDVVADFDGDGFLDLATGSATFVKICRGLSSTTFAPAEQVLLGTALLDHLNFATDVDGDGSPDIVGTGVAYTTLVLLNDATGSFVVGDYATGMQEASLSPAVADFTGDGKPDIAAAAVGTGSGGSVRILVQHCFH